MQNDNGIIAGNICNKFETANLLIRFLMQRFLNAVRTILAPYQSEISSVTEAGCGEGYLSAILLSWGYKNIRACDISRLIIEEAQALQKNYRINFYVKSIYDLDATDAADLMIGSEVLEHLEDPRRALERLAQGTQKYCLLTVPYEPWWRLMNMLRGKYLKRKGNTPGHLHRWSRSSFRKLGEEYFDLLAVKTAFPWILLLGRKR